MAGMISRERNYAFIDGQNMHKGTVRQGWRVGYGKLRIYLRNKYQVEKAYIFLGYIKENEPFYQKIERHGFIILFKEVSYGPNGMVKGNCDSDMVLRICMDFWNFDKAVIISGDGDFYSMCQVLSSLDKFRVILAPNKAGFSERYYRFGSDKVDFLSNNKDSIAQKVFIRNEKTP
jgi:uncharacterized LabA/DUF88 family protein